MKRAFLFLCLIVLFCSCDEIAQEVTEKQRQTIAEEIKQHQKKMRELFEVSNIENFNKWTDELVPGTDEVWVGKPAMWVNMTDLYPNATTLHKVYDPIMEQRKSTEIKVKKDYVSVLSPQSAVYVFEGSFSATNKQGNTTGDMPLSGTFVYVKRNNSWKVLHTHYSWIE